MKKLSFLFIYIFLLIGCDDKVSISKEEYNKLKQAKVSEYPKYIGKISTNDNFLSSSKNIYIFEMDSCEYIGSVTNTSSDVFSHRARCKFCAQRKINAQ